MTSRGIGFVYFNSNERQTMETASVSINQVEELTGYDFFGELPDDLEETIEDQNKLSGWH
jgi:endonuclease G